MQSSPAFWFFCPMHTINIQHAEIYDSFSTRLAEKPLPFAGYLFPQPCSFHHPLHVLEPVCRAIQRCGGSYFLFYLGYLAYHHHQFLDSLLTRRRIFCWLAMAVVVALCIPWANQHYAVGWLLSCLGCLFTYQCSLLALPSVYGVLKRNICYVYFEKNAFRYYLFHMPTALVVFMSLNALTSLSLLPFIALSFGLTLAFTTIIVLASHVVTRSWDAWMK